MNFQAILSITGERLLGLFGVDVQSFAVAGAIILLLLGLEMILGIEIFKDDPESKSGTLVPIAFPLIAGAGTMTTIISLQKVFGIILLAIAVKLFRENFHLVTK